ncbi:MAG: ATP-binding protein [Xanthomonadales bacterium]|nr:ATP-binding protein [Xanthomonadales bacterium]
MQKHEKHYAWRLARNVLRYLPTRHPAFGQLLEEIGPLAAEARHAALWAEGARRGSLCGTSEDEKAVDAQEICWHSLAAQEIQDIGRVRPAAIDRRMQLLGELFRLDETSLEIVRLLYFTCTLQPVQGLFEVLERILKNPARAIAVALGCSTSSIERRIGQDATLRINGVIEDFSCDRLSQAPELSREVQKLLCTPVRSARDARQVLLGSPLGAALEWPDFCHLGEDRQFICDLLAGALRRRETGVNVLLFGAPGTGKTEFAKTLGRQLHKAVYAIGEREFSDGPPNFLQRLAQVQMGQRLLERTGKAVLLVDEADDLLSHGNRESLRPLLAFRNPKPGAAVRVYVQRVLEESTVPMVWICNEIRDINPAILRRFSFSLEVRSPPERARRTVWQRCLTNNGFENSEPVAARCARLPVSPGIAAQAIRSSRLAGRGAEGVERVTRQIGRVATGRPLPPAESRGLGFDPELVHCRKDIGALSDQLARGSDRRFSICVDGPPGSGKSAWIRHLAERLGMEVLQKRASDLLSMFVGGTEARIAEAFEEAESQKSFLVFDEAESFLQDRAGAYRSWETTRVNEMLTWMDSHPLPFALTTNRIESIDPAAMRRLIFKLHFDYLRPRQVYIAFQNFFGQEWPADRAVPDCLTVGDFVVVADRARIQVEVRQGRLAQWLIDECAHKPRQSRAIGFV